jgi:nitrate/TMAO reductase-like tetraheme cytochrome c subunit
MAAMPRPGKDRWRAGHERARHEADDSLECCNCHGFVSIGPGSDVTIAT